MGIVDAINNGLEPGRMKRINKAYSKMMATKAVADDINARQSKRYARYRRGKTSTFNIFAKVVGAFSYVAYKANARKQRKWNDKFAKRESYFNSKESEYQRIYGRASGVGSSMPPPLPPSPPTRDFQAAFNDPRLAQRKAAAATTQKAIDPVRYKSTKSDLEPTTIVDKNGNAVAEYKHLNADAKEIEIDVRNPAAHISEFENIGGVFHSYKRAKMNLKLNDKFELDLSLPENAQFVKDPDRLADILYEHPEAYKTIPQSYFGFGGLNRNDVLDMVKEGVKNKAANPSEISMFERDADGNSTGRKLGVKEFVEQMYNITIEKDKELLTFAETITYATKIAEMHSKAAHAKTHMNSAGEIDDFFDKAKI